MHPLTQRALALTDPEDSSRAPFPCPGKSEALKEKEERARAVEELRSYGSGLFQHLKTSTGASASQATSVPPAPAAVSPAGVSPSKASPVSADASAPSGREAQSQWPASLRLGHAYCLDKEVFLAQYGQRYGYGGRIDQLYPAEVGARMKPNEHYLDYTGV